VDRRGHLVEHPRPPMAVRVVDVVRGRGPRRAAVRRYPVARRPADRSRARLSALLANATSGCPQIALTTAIPAAPVARTDGARLAATPAVGTQGHGLAQTL